MSTTATAQSIVGDWQGTLKTPGPELRLVLHIKVDGASLKGTLDSVDQGANGIPVASLVLKDGKVTLSAVTVNGKYDGTLSADGNTIEGTWSQGTPLPLTFRRAAATKPSDIDGAWKGILDTGSQKLRLIFHLSNTLTGLAVAMDSVDQGANGIPGSATREGSTLRFLFKQFNGTYEGTISQDLKSIDGNWSQGVGALPLRLERNQDAETVSRRPQNPVKPYPYREEEVQYENKSAGNKLAATLTIPPGKGPFPAVVLITGSGPQDRDESLWGHKPFLVLADYLTRKGILVLRADDRGVGTSTGKFSTATSLDFATDAEASLAYLKSRPEANPKKLGFVGHSEGGLIGPMVAARNPDVAFIVMMAGPGVPGDILLTAQGTALIEASGGSHDAAERNAQIQATLFALVRQEKNDADVLAKAKEKFAGKLPDAQIEAQAKAVSSPWFRYFLDYDPSVALRKVKCPVLAINGEKDRQIPPALNLPAIRKAFEAGGNTKVEVAELAGLNHLFQTAKTGGVGEYGEIEETISPVALEKIGAWILKQ